MSGNKPDQNPVAGYVINSSGKATSVVWLNGHFPKAPSAFSFNTKATKLPSKHLCVEA